MEANVLRSKAEYILANGGDTGAELDKEFRGFYFCKLSVGKQDGIDSGFIVCSLVGSNALDNGCPEADGAHGGVEIALHGDIFISFIPFLKLKVDDYAIG